MKTSLIKNHVLKHINLFQFRNKLVAFIFYSTIIYILILGNLHIDLVCIAHCVNPAAGTDKSSFNITEVFSTGAIFTGSMYLLKTLPPNMRVATASALTTGTIMCKVAKHACDTKTAEKLAGITASTKQPPGGGFKASSCLEVFNTYQFEHSLIILCIFLILLAVIAFTVIILWVIIHKYSSVIIFLKSKTNNKFVYTCIEKIQQISSLHISYVLLFVYVCLISDIYLLLNYFK